MDFTTRGYRYEQDVPDNQSAISCRNNITTIMSGFFEVPINSSVRSFRIFFLIRMASGCFLHIRAFKLDQIYEMVTLVTLTVRVPVINGTSSK